MSQQSSHKDTVFCSNLSLLMSTAGQMEIKQRNTQQMGFQTNAALTAFHHSCPSSIAMDPALVFFISMHVHTAGCSKIES